ncbi:hypothetical protein OF83DRAFT_1067502 [Amylostereum chailletii]|nr:hypothetical protein OF83DRAFT_1067502 [Amylostereum chailletii]
MHLCALNLTDLLLGLWRCTLECDKNDDRATWDWAALKDPAIWALLGAFVAAIRAYWPGSFDHIPRNPAERINSGYKAWEFLLLVYGLFPVLLYRILPDKYWRNFCKLVFAIRILHQRCITREELIKAHKALIEFEEEYHLLYFQRKVSRIHFVRQSVHQVVHAVPENIRVGPLGLTTQWPMERMIGDLGSEIRQHSKAYANLSQRAARRARDNALKAMVPDLVPPEGPPRGAKVLGDGYTLLRAMDQCSRVVRNCEAVALRSYIRGALSWPEAAVDAWDGSVIRWARLRLLTEQVSWSSWKEVEKGMENVRISRVVKLAIGAEERFGEVLFYCQLPTVFGSTDGDIETVAVVSLFSRPDTELLEVSYGTALLVCYKGDVKLCVVSVKAIWSVVAMIPLPEHLRIDEPAPIPTEAYTVGRGYFVVEKLGLDVILRGWSEIVPEDE